MKKLIGLNALLSFLLIGTIALPAVADHKHRDVAVDQDAMLRSLDDLMDQLDDIERMTEHNSSRGSRDRINDKIKDMRHDLREMRRTVREAPIVEHAPPPPPPPPEEPVPPPIEAMPQQSFSDLIHAIDGASFSDQKLALVKDACKYHFFSTAQVIAVMKEMSFGKDKVAAAAMMYPKLVDPDQFFKVYEHLDFDSDREKLRRQVTH